MTQRNVSGWLPNLIGPIKIQGNGTEITPLRQVWNFQGATITDVFVEDGVSYTNFNIAGSGGAEAASPTIANASTGTINNAPSTSGVDVGGAIRFSGSAPSLGGIASGTGGRALWLVTTGGPLILQHEAASSTAANRFTTSTGASVTIPVNAAVLVWYDAASSRWRVPSTAGETSVQVPAGTAGDLVTIGSSGNLGSVPIAGVDGDALLKAASGGIKVAGAFSRLRAIEHRHGSVDADLRTTIKPALGVQTTDGATWTTVYSVDLSVADNNALSEFVFRARAIKSDASGAAFFSCHRAFRMSAGVLVAYPQTDTLAGGDNLALTVAIRITFTGTTVQCQVLGGTGLTLDWTGSIDREKSVSSAGGSPPPPAGFSPSSLTLTSWERASYASAPWSGTASAGSSGANSMTAGVAPAVGAAVNALTPADFNGTTHYLTSSTTLAALLPTTGYAGCALVWIDTIATNNAVSEQNNGILGSATSNRFWLTLRSNNTVRCGHYDATNAVDANAPVTLGAWQLIHWEFSGTTVRVGVNGTWTATVTATTMQDGGFSLMLGKNAGDIFFDGKVLELMTKSGVWGASDIADIRAYCNSRYGLAI